MSKPFIDVAAGLIMTPDRQLLLAQRPEDKAWSGWWELPGGKTEPGETPAQALVRELHEELGIGVTEATPWITYTHEYPKTIVRLAFHRVTGWTGDPAGIEGQALAWTGIDGPLSVSPLLPATLPPLRWLQLPDRYLLTSIGTSGQLDAFMQKLTAALESEVRLVQFREPAWAARTGQHDQEQLYRAFQGVLARCRQYGAACVVNSVHPVAWAQQADGIHYRSVDAAKAAAAKTLGTADTTSKSNKPDGLPVTPETGGTPQLPGAQRGSHYVGVSVHTQADLGIARQLNADFAVLGHVLDTPSHPGVPGMGWDRFRELNRYAGLPVFAIGGQSASTLQIAKEAGAHGIAGMRLSL